MPSFSFTLPASTGIEPAPTANPPGALDFALDATGDLAFTGGDFSLTAGLAGIAQLCCLAVGTVLGEWHLDQSVGVDWYGSILVKNPNVIVVREIIRAALLGVPGVVAVTSVDFQVFTDRTATITFAVQTDLGLAEGTVSVP